MELWDEMQLRLYRWSSHEYQDASLVTQVHSLTCFLFRFIKT